VTPSTWPISTPIGYPREFPVRMNPRNPELQLLQIIARGTLRAASYVSSAMCAATSYPEGAHVGERSAMQNAQPVGQPVRLHTRVKMSRAELMFGAALTGSRTVVMSRTVPSADTQMLNQEMYLVGRQMIR